MPTIERNQFSAGLIPSDDEANGRDNGFLQMDNCWLDDNGSVEMARGSIRINPVPRTHPLLYIYSKILNGVKWRYILDGGTVYRDFADFTSPVTVLTGGGEKAAFSTGFGQVFVASGLARVKDDGTTLRDLGIEAPVNPPTVTPITPQFINVTGNNGGTSADYAAFTLIEGGNLSAFATWVQASTDTATFRAIIQNIYSPVINTLNLSGGHIGDNQDTFTMQFQINDAAFLDNVRVIFLLGTPTGTTQRAVDVSDYYYHDFQNNFNSNYSPGVFAWSTLTCKRGDFIRVGTDASKNWTNIVGIRIVVQCNNGNVTGPFGGINGFSVSAPTFTDQSQGSNGVYRYVQVNVFEGDYAAQSPGGPRSQEITLTGGGATLTPDITNLDPQVNWIYWFRMGGTLPDFYFVGKQPYPNGVLTDITSDADALLINIRLNQFLQSVEDIPDEILGMSSAVNGRVFYMTFKEIFVSDYYNPDAYDSRKVIQLSSIDGIGEINLFLAQSSSSILYIGTTSDIYEISGTFADLPDGTMDIFIRPLGVRQPPLNETFAIQNNLLFYIADDGPRYLINSQSVLLSTELMWLWKGIDRYQMVGFLIIGGNLGSYRLAIHKDKLWMAMPDTQCGNNIYIYDLGKKYWYRLIGYGVQSLFNEEDGTLISGNIDGFLRVMDITYQLDGANQVINLRTPLTKELPYQRKDMYTLKLMVDTGGSPAQVWMGDESVRPPVFLGNFTANGLTEVFFTLSGTVHNLKKRLSIQLFAGSLAGIAYFRLTNWSVEYDARPVQRTHYRIPPSNLGIPARKRIRTLPIVIDTLGNPVTFTPNVDLVPYVTPTTLTSADKQTLYHFFGTDVFGVDYGGILAGDNEFEFYNLEAPADVETIPVPKTYDQIGPVQFDRAGKLLEFRLRILPLENCTSIHYNVIVQDTSIYQGDLPVVPLVDDTYSVKVPRGTIGRVCRIEFSSASPFCRWKCQLRVNLSGMKSQNSWITAKEPVSNLNT